jgi:hypothetical protein
MAIMLANSENSFNQEMPLLYEDEQGQLKVNPDASMLLGGLFN